MNELILEAGQSNKQYWRDVWRYRELFYFIAWRDILVRYKQTVIGAAWAVLRPVLTMVILSFVFGRIAKLPSEGVPYPLLVFCGTLPWQFFAHSLQESGNSLVNNANMVRKVYFPRIVVPSGSIMTSFVDFAIAAVILGLMMLWYRHIPGPAIAFLPLLVATTAAASLGAGLWISALMVQYRDFRFIVPFIVQFGLYITPVGFSTAVVPEKFRLLYSLNPMVGIIDGYRWALLGGNFQMYWLGFMLSAGVVAAVLASGLWYFRRTERIMADLI